MTEIYSESFRRLFDELDISLEPAGPEQLHDVADPAQLDQVAGVTTADIQDVAHRRHCHS